MDCHSFYEVSQWRRWQGVVFTNSSLWELFATSGNLSMGIIIHSWNSFSFLFLYWLLVICGGLPPFVRGEVAKQQGGWERNWKLKIEAQSGKMICLHNHFSLSSHEVRNERSEDQNWKLIFHLKLIL